MAGTLTHLTVFVAWPGGVEKERKAVFDAVALFNATYGKTFGVVVEAKDWKTAVRPARGRPQAVINEQIGEYDVWVGIVGTRLGSDAGKGKTGFVEEFEIADARWRYRRKGQKPGLMLYFRDQASINLRDADLKQLQAVQDFRKDLEGRRTIYFGTYTSPGNFEQQIRTDLINELLARLQQATGLRPPALTGPASGAPPASLPARPAKESSKSAGKADKSKAAKAPRRPSAPSRPSSLRLKVPFDSDERKAFALKALRATKRHFQAEAKAFNADHTAHRGKAAFSVTAQGEDGFEASVHVKGERAHHFRVRMEKTWQGWAVLLEQAHTVFDTGPRSYSFLANATVQDDPDGRALHYELGYARETSVVAADVARHLWDSFQEALEQRR